MGDQRKSRPNALSDTKSLKLCVYTSLMGGYEDLNEQPTASQSGLPFICFTDDPGLQSDTWEVRLISPMLPMDPARSQRDFKLKPHVHLPEFDFSLYIDNSILLKQPPERMFEKYMPASGFSLPRNTLRDSVLDEFLEVSKRGYDDQTRIFEQLNHYLLTCPEILEEQPYAAGIMIRDHRNPQVLAMLDIWYANILRYSRRDLLSINAAFRQAEFVPDEMEFDLWGSDFHSWPHIKGRKRTKANLSPGVSFSPPLARVRQLELELAEKERLLDETLSSEAWRIGKRLADATRRHPRLLGPVWGTAGRLSRRRGTRQ